MTTQRADRDHLGPTAADTPRGGHSPGDRLTTDSFLGELWPTLWQSMDDGLIIADEEGRFVYATPSFCRMVGYPVGELLGNSISLVIPDDRLDEYLTAFRRMTREEPPGQTADVVVRRKDGELIQLNFRHSRLELGERTLHALVVRDVTHQRLMEQQLLQSDRMKALGTLAGGVAHEFNNLLVSILGYGEMIEESEPLDEAQVRRFARKIQRAARRGTQLTGQLLPFARRDEVQKRPVDVHEVLREVVGLFRSSLGSELRVEAELLSPRFWVRGNPLQLQQVFLNIFLNARDAMPEGGVLDVSTGWVERPEPALGDERAAPGGYLRVRVEDTGLGMDDEVLRRMFEPFYTTRPTNAGLGLALVYSSVKNHGGVVFVQSRPGQGSTIDVYLPALAQGPG